MDDKISLLDGCTTVKRAIECIESDQAISSPSVRSSILKKISGYKFTGVGSMEEYLRAFDDLVRKYTIAGGIYNDGMMVSQICATLPEQYDPTTEQFTNFTTFGMCKERLLERDRKLKNRIDDK